uniref:Ficolin-2-like n=1 Tax=Phallusia mammillata TaxID=59560 RepID=A0A6F9DC26_9ASCI|nr:ficolin-2-like [Phallusia mammillata]
MLRMTSGRNCRLRIDLRGFDDSEAFAQYTSFAVGNESDNYRLQVSGYSGTAGDSLIKRHNGMQFSTQDRDHDTDSSINCVLRWGNSGGWWFKNCFYSKLNAEWGRSEGHNHNIIWYHWKGWDEGIKESTMKIRCD